ncbi:FMRFamide receptor-like [Liolophura sinensis]|uniref:FMRFamide receptor-like n=1 Tax=Liolophura sinensis TaxID=3198878 RepID=UPI0031596B64
MASNVWIILAFAVERLFAICFPLKSRVISSESRAKKIVVAIFVIAVFVNAPRFFRIAVTTKLDDATNETIHVWTYTQFGRDPFSTKAIYMSFAIIVVIIPFPLLATLNCLVIVKLRDVRRSRMRLKGVDVETTADADDSKQIQIERVLVASLLAFLFCYSLVASTFLTFAFEGVYVLRKFNLEIRLRFLIAPCLFVFNPCLNFILYVMCSKILREDVKELFCGIFALKTKRSTTNR